MNVEYCLSKTADRAVLSFLAICERINTNPAIYRLGFAERDCFSFFIRSSVTRNEVGHS